jgi:hypothetical protein
MELKCWGILTFYDIEMCIYIDMYVSTYIHIYAVALQKIQRRTGNGFPSDFAYSVSLFAHLENRSLLLICRRRNKRKLSVYKKTQRTSPFVQKGYPILSGNR